MSKINIESLFEGLETGVLTEETKTKLETLINETVEARVQAKEKLLKEETDSLKEKIKKESEENEKTLVEEAEKFKKNLEETTVEETIKFRDAFSAEKEKEVEDTKQKFKELVLEEAKTFKAKQDVVLVEEVKKFKAELIEKVSDYIEAKLVENIPAEIMESATKLNVLEPLITGIMESFASNYIKLDTSSYKMIKEAKDEISRLETQLQEQTKLEVKIKKEKSELERSLKIAKLTEGLTQSQKMNAEKLLEGVENLNLESHYKKIQDIVINEQKQVIEKQEKLQENKQVVKPEVTKVEPKKVIQESEIVKHQLKKILNEETIKEVTGTSKASKTDSKIQIWANRVKPGYVEEPKK